MKLLKMGSSSKILICFWVLAAFHVLLRIMDELKVFKGPFLLHIASKCAPILTLIVMSYKSSFKPNRVKTRTLLALGLVFSVCGDFSIEFDIAKGIIFFAVAHIMYVACFFQKASCICVKGLITSTCLFVLIGMFNFEAPPSHLKYPVLGYCAIISMMLWRGIAVSAEGSISDHSKKTWMGCAIFMLSDLVLSVLLFHNYVTLGRSFVMVTYYTGQFIIAWSLSPKV
eukprot:TRINITY_DN289652_c0_g1_i1.p1 TRINITY_DN289652_c0_g1~~TRINITY_DN289652_c0_g1_i1.p1  ORF type:complete len:227 (+),score=37.23 TRINITY_DN289652_c0_g1_i1:116-796(+)